MSNPSQANAAVSKIERKAIEGHDLRLQEWLRTHVAGCTTCKVVASELPSAGGLSSETFILELTDAAFERVVVKKDVRLDTTNPQARFDTAVTMHTVLGAVPGMQVPRLLGVDHSGEVLGSSFMVMEHVQGAIPADVPSYAAHGWVRDASDDQRRAMWQGGVDFLVKLHRFDWQQHDLGHLEFDAPGGDPLERCLNWSIRLFREQAQGRTATVIEQAIIWLQAWRPEQACAHLIWGDARIGNIIWRDFAPQAVIDWEMATIGVPGIDLGWWSFFHRWSTYGQGLSALGGTCVGQALAELYEARGGNRIGDFGYYEVLATLRGLSIWLRTFDALRSQGAIPDLDPLSNQIHIIRVLELLMQESRSFKTTRSF